jgi:hypothetical protein
MWQDNYPVAVYCINPKYDIDADYRLNFLKEQGVIVESIYNAFDLKLNAVHHTMRYLFQANEDGILPNELGPLCSRTKRGASFVF